MASEVANVLGIELSDLNYICCHVFLASKCSHILNETEEEEEEEKRLPLISGAQRAPLIKTKDSLQKKNHFEFDKCFIAYWFNFSLLFTRGDASRSISRLPSSPPSLSPPPSAIMKNRNK